MRRAFCFFFISTFLVLRSFADPMHLKEYFVLKQGVQAETKWYEYLPPNEQNPVDLLPILESAPRGRGFFVGSERGLIAAGMSDKITGLDLVDYNPQIVFLNTVNWALLKISTSRKHYLQLRFSDDLKTWIEAAKASKNQFAIDILNQESTFAWWRQAMRHVKDNSAFHKDPKLEEIDRRFATNIEFEQANYLFYEEQFARVKALVDRDAIRIARVDLKNIAAVMLFIEDLSIRKSKYSVVDISNAWQPGYLGPIHTSIFFSAMIVKMSVDGIFVVTNQAKWNLPDGKRRFRKIYQLAWQYAGFRVDHAEKFKNLFNFVAHYMGHQDRFPMVIPNHQTTLDTLRLQPLCAYLFR